MGLIYKITNLVNGKIYIGKTIAGLGKRWSQHKDCARNRQKGCRGDSYLYRAMRKHGTDNFTIDAIDSALLDEILLDKEMEWIAKLKSTDGKIGYNSTFGGQGGVPSPETLARMKGKPCSPETRAKISAANKGRIVSQEVKDKLSAINKGKPMSPERYAAHCAKPPCLGQKRTPEQIEHMRAGINAAWTPELRARVSVLQRESRAKHPRPGHPIGEKQRKTMSENMRLRWQQMPADKLAEIGKKFAARVKGVLQSPELIKKRSEAIRKAWTPEKRKAFGEKQTGRKGHIPSLETREKMRIAAIKRCERQRLGKVA